MNKVFISGRLTDDVKKTTSESGGEYVRFSIAVERYAKNEKKTIFVKCIAFGHSANFLNAYCHKGSKVYIEGELDCSISEKDGNKVSYWTVIANNIEADKPKTEEPKVEDDGETLPFEM